MKVGVVYPILFGEEEGSYGGGERYAWELARALSGQVDTVLVTTGRRRTSRREEGLRIEVYPWRTLVHAIRANPLSLRFLESLLDADVVHCVSYSTLLTDLSVLFARLTGRKVFITDVGGGGDVSLARLVDVMALSNGPLLLSNFSARSFPKHQRRARVIYGGVDTDRFRPAEGDDRREPGKVLYVGRLYPHKGVNYLIEALQPGMRLVIAGRTGHPPYVQYLTQLAAGKNVCLLTDATDDAIVAEYQSSMVAVLPSVYETVLGSHTPVPELLGLTLLEAMACGTPVICTDVGSLPEVVQDGVTGLVVPPNDSRALADALERLVCDPARVEQMGAAARRSVLERFTWARVAERCLRAYAA